MSAADVGQGGRHCGSPVRRRSPTFFGPVFRCLDQLRPPTSVQLADIQASVGCQHCRSSFLTLRPTLDADVGLSVGQCRPPTLSVQFFDTQADVGCRRRRECRPTGPTSAADVGLSVRKLDRQCQRPTLVDTQSVTLVIVLTLDGYPTKMPSPHPQVLLVCLFTPCNPLTSDSGLDYQVHWTPFFYWVLQLLTHSQ